MKTTKTLFAAALLLTACAEEPTYVGKKTFTTSATALTVTEKSRADIHYQTFPQATPTWTLTQDDIVDVEFSGDSTLTVTGMKAGKTDLQLTCHDIRRSIAITVTPFRIPVTKVNVVPSRMDLYTGDSLQLRAVITPHDASDTVVTWRSLSPQVATVTDGGLVRTLTSGYATIQATTRDGALTADCELAVTDRIYHVDSITLSDEALTLRMGEKGTLTATVWPENATNKTLLWSSTNPLAASVDDRGEVTALTPGTAVVTAASSDGNRRALCTVTVTDTTVYVTGVALDCTAAEMIPGGTLQLTAVVSPENATDKSVTWTTKDASTALVSGKGLISALKPGVTIIGVKTADGGFEDFCTVTVRDTNVYVTSVELDCESAQINQGSTLQLNATVLPENATNKSVTWSSSDNNIATVTGKGLVRGLMPGTTTIGVRTADGGREAFCTVTVKDTIVYVTGVQLDTRATQLNQGSTLQLTATVSPANATNKGVTWSSKDASTAVVSGSGLISALKPGVTIISVKTADGGFEDFCTVTVRDTTVYVTGVELDRESAQIDQGASLQLNATVLPKNATNKGVTWSTKDKTIATVSATGLVRGLLPGTTTIGVRTADGGREAFCTVTVRDTTVYVTGVTLDQETAQIDQGASLQLTATVLPENATNKGVTWSTKDKTIATVSATGLVKGLLPGSTTIGVRTADGGREAFCSVTVRDTTVYVTGVELDRESAVLTTGESLRLTASVSPENATNKSVTWKSSNTEVATVSDGLVKSLRAGSATISVKTTDGGFEDLCQLTVNDPFVHITEITLTQQTMNMNRGESKKLTATVNPADATDKTILWQSANEKVATVEDGVVTAVGEGSTQITATTKDGGKKASCTVTVIVPVTSLVMNEKEITLLQEQTHTLVAEIKPADATLTTLTWKSENESVARVDQKGVVTAVRQGETLVRATSHNGLEATCKVIVENLPDELLSLQFVDEKGNPITELNFRAYEQSRTTTVTTLLTYRRNGLITKVRGNDDNYATASLADYTWKYVEASGTQTATLTEDHAQAQLTAAHNGQARLTCTANAKNGMRGTQSAGLSVSIDFQDIFITALSVKRTTPEKMPYRGKQLSATFTCTAVFSDNSTRDITREVQWTYSAEAGECYGAGPGVMIINSLGTINDKTGVHADARGGRFTATAKSADGKLSASSYVDVHPSFETMAFAVYPGETGYTASSAMDFVIRCTFYGGQTLDGGVPNFGTADAMEYKTVCRDGAGNEDSAVIIDPEDGAKGKVTFLAPGNYTIMCTATDKKTGQTKTQNFNATIK